MAKIKKPKHIAVAGNIGAGKTTLTELLSKHYKWIPHFEDVDHIQKRGREYEENIRLDYLKRLNEYYNKWIENYKEGLLLVVDIDKNKFPENEEHLGEIIRRVDSELYGLF